MLDMGGASMQIAYEVPSESQTPEDLVMPFRIGDRKTYKVYVMTFLSYGTHATKSRYEYLNIVTLFLDCYELYFCS